MGIDVIIILTIVFMVGRRDKYRVQVNSLHLQALQIAEFIPDSPDIASIETSHIHLGRKLIPVPHPLHGFPNIDVFIRFHIICRVTVTKTIYINLIHNCALAPIRYKKSGSHMKRCLPRRLICRPQTAVETDILLPVRPEAVIQDLFSKYIFTAVIIKQAVAVAVFHVTLFHSILFVIFY